jgi:hypothetical protein
MNDQYKRNLFTYSMVISLSSLVRRLRWMTWLMFQIHLHRGAEYMFGFTMDGEYIFSPAPLRDMICSSTSSASDISRFFSAPLVSTEMRLRPLDSSC